MPRKTATTGTRTPRKRPTPASISDTGTDTETDTSPDTPPSPARASPHPSSFPQWHQHAQQLGLTQSQMIWELHIVHGRPMGETAHLLGLTAAQATTLFQEHRHHTASTAPQSDEDLAAVREELRQRLISIIEDASHPPDDPRLLSIRQRACEQIANLYGLKIQRRPAPTTGTGPTDSKTAPYILPAELAPLVEQHLLTLYGRSQQITAARLASPLL